MHRIETRFKGRWAAYALVIGVLLAGCGGGGSSGSYQPGGSLTQTPTHRDRLPTLSQDIPPPGARIDQSSQNLFPSALGDRWVYDRFEPGTSFGSVTRTVTYVNGSDVDIAESRTTGPVTEHYRRTAQGRVDLQPDPSRGIASSPWAALPALDVPLLVDAEPLYDFGMTRRVLRQGDWGRDLDGDGITESFRFEYDQTLVDRPLMTLVDGTQSVSWHFLNQSVLTLVPSDLSKPEVSLVTSEQVWWAPGLGMLRRDRLIYDTTGTIWVKGEVLTLKSGFVGGKTLFTQGGASASSALIKIPLAHNDLVFDAVHGVYYASVPGSVIGNGNSIATIDSASGQVSFSAPIGSEPGPLALSADGTSLYVGLTGSGEVVRLGLPGFQEISRTRLPVATFYGMTTAETLSVSPLDASVVAVAMRYIGTSPGHAGVGLIRAGVLQPTMTSALAGGNLIVFGADGQNVYSFNNQTTEFGLRRLSVLANGLSQSLLISSGLGNFGTRSVSLSAQGVVVERSIYQTPTLTLGGSASSNVTRCRAHTVVPNRLVCRDGALGLPTGKVAVVDASTFVLLATPLVQTPTASYEDVIPGPSGQVALRFGNTYSLSVSNELWLMNSPDLP